MAKSALWFGISFAVMSTTVGSAILASPNGAYNTVMAIVVFNATDFTTNTSERLGSADPHDEIGKYGKSSPEENINGLVQLAAKLNGHRYGCSEPYQNVNPKKTWIALIERGDCSFSQKIKEARLANATGVVIFDHDDGVLLMSHDDEEKIVAVSIPKDVGESVVDQIESGKVVTVKITRGHMYTSQYSRGNKTSIIFVSLSFLILMIISLTWLIVYYVQRFRLIHTPDILKKRRAQARKIVSSLPKKLLKEGDKELTSEEICPICIENYKAEETLRILPCKHIFHRKCVDPWLRVRETCPMCKLDVMKSKGLTPSPYDRNFIFGTSTPIVEVWEPSAGDDEPTSSNSSDSLVSSLEYRESYQESTIIAVVEGENSHTHSISNSARSPSEESTLEVQTPTLSNPDTPP